MLSLNTKIISNKNMNNHRNTLSHLTRELLWVPQQLVQGSRRKFGEGVVGRGKDGERSSPAQGLHQAGCLHGLDKGAELLVARQGGDCVSVWWNDHTVQDVNHAIGGVIVNPRQIDGRALSCAHDLGELSREIDLSDGLVES